MAHPDLRGITILDSDPFDLIEELASLVVQQPRAPSVAAQLDYERGLAAIKALATGADWERDFALFEASLRENLGDEQRYGPSEQTRRDRRRIVEQLNVLALTYVGMSFNDLCLGKQPSQ